VIIDLIITSTDDGFNADVPSINGFDCWSADEDELIQKSLELVSFYLTLSEEQTITVDRVRREGKKTTYKLIFEK